MSNFLYTSTNAQQIHQGLGINKQLSNSIVLLGDSRMAQFMIDGSPFASNRTTRTKAAHFLSWASALNGGLLSFRAAFGRSGWRTDQYLNYLDEALSYKASIYAIFGVVNDIAQYATTGDTADTIYARLETAILKILYSGFTPLVFIDPGATNFTTTHHAMLQRINERLVSLAETYNGILLFDMANVVWDMTSATFAFKSGYSADGVHYTTTGNYFIGKALGDFLAKVLNPTVNQGGNVSYLPANGNIFQVVNPLMLTTTGGTLNTGITGAAPASFACFRTGTSTAVASVIDAPDGRGKAIKFDVTGVAEGQYIRVQQDMVNTNFAAGDIIEFGAKALVNSGAENMKMIGLWGNVGGQANPVADLYNDTGGVLPSDLNTRVLTLRSLPYKLESGFSWVSWQVRGVANAAGNFSFTVWNPTCKRKTQW